MCIIIILILLVFYLLDKGEKLKGSRPGGGSYKNGMYLTVGGGIPPLKVNDEVFEQIVKGKKTYDIRINAEKSWVRRSEPPEEITFITKDKSKQVTATITKVKELGSIKELNDIKDIDTNKIFPGKSVQEGLDEFYNNDNSRDKMKGLEKPYKLIEFKVNKKK